MTGPLNFKSLREKLEKKFPKLRVAKGNSSIIPSAKMDEVLLATKAQYPRLPVWENIEHPRDNYFSIHILPLHLPLHPTLEEPIKDLQKQMLADGVNKDFCMLQDLYEERFSHVWVAETQRWIFKPVGMCTFLYRETSGSKYPIDEGSFSSTGKEKWWFNYAWLNPAQRNHRVLRNTVPYFKIWHPDFKLTREHPIVDKSLKDYPEHKQSRTGKSMMYE